MAHGSTESINANTTLVDLGLFGIKRVGAVYLLRGQRSCLIDSGTAAEAKGLVRALDALGAFPPDAIILTHSHYDHSQGVPSLCRAARRRGKNIQVMASERALDNLRDQSWNRVFDDKHSYENIYGVVPLRDQQTIDLGGLKLRIVEVAGHCDDDIAIYDEANRTVILGDCLGYRVAGQFSFPPFMPPFWDEDGFRAAVGKLEALDYETLCLAHFGCLRGDEARRYPDEAAATVDSWLEVFADVDRAGRLDDLDYLVGELIGRLGLVLPHVELTKPHLELVLSLINLVRKPLGKPPVTVAQKQLEGIAGWLIKGYRGRRRGR